MTETNNKISVSQLFCLLILTRLAGEIVYPRDFCDDVVTSICAVALAEVIQLLLALPAIIYSFRGEDFYRAVYRKGRFIGWLTAITAALLMTVAAVMSVFCSSKFAVKNLLNNASMWVIIAISVVFAVYVVVMGAESAARAGSIFLVAALIVTLAVILADIPYYKISDIDISLKMELQPFLTEVIRSISRGGDYLIFTAFIPLVAKKNQRSTGKCGLLFGVTALVTTVGIAVVCGLVLRYMYGAVEYPFIAAASLADVVFFKRIDGWAAGVWVLCGVLRAGVFLLCVKQTILSVVKAAERGK